MWRFAGKCGAVESVSLARVVRLIYMTGEVWVELTDGARSITSWPLQCTQPGLAVVDRLARLQLAARHIGWSIRVLGASDDLAALIRFAGLDDVLTLEPRR
jgi:hypothetical protein